MEKVICRSCGEAFELEDYHEDYVLDNICDDCLEEMGEDDE